MAIRETGMLPVLKVAFNFKLVRIGNMAFTLFWNVDYDMKMLQLQESHIVIDQRKAGPILFKFRRIRVKYDICYSMVLQQRACF